MQLKKGDSEDVVALFLGDEMTTFGPFVKDSNGNIGPFSTNTNQIGPWIIATNQVGPYVVTSTTVGPFTKGAT